MLNPFSFSNMAASLRTCAIACSVIFGNYSGGL
jgi:hypothetical protein